MSIGKTTELSSVSSSQIVDGAVTSAKIAAGAVGSSALASSSVVAASIAAGAVGSAALASGAVVSAAIASGAVGSAALADNAVVSSKINSGSATSGQILQANGSGGVSFATPSAGTISINNVTANYTLALSDAGNIVANSNTASEIEITIPLNSSVAFPVGTIIRIAQPTGKQVRVTASSGVTAPWTSTIYKYTPYQGAYVEIAKYTTDTWIQQNLNSYSNGAGYVYAGENSSGAITTIDKFPYSSEVYSTLSATSLTKNSAIGITNPGVAGYAYGGSSTSVGKLTYSTEAASTVSGSAGASIDYLNGTGVETTTAGYVMGGYSGSYLSGIRKVLYSTDTLSTLSAGISDGAAYVTHHSNYGSFGVRYRGATGSTRFDSVDKLTYSTETVSAMTAVTSTTQAHAWAAGAGDTGKNGYVFGGLNASSTRISTIMKMGYGTTTHAAISTALSTVVYAHHALNNPGVGAYIYIGNSGTVQNKHDKFNYSTDTNQSLSAGLSVGRTLAAGMSNWG